MILPPVAVRITKGRHLGKKGQRIQWCLCSRDGVGTAIPSTTYWPVVLDEDPTEVVWLHESAIELVKP